MEENTSQQNNESPAQTEPVAEATLAAASNGDKSKEDKKAEDNKFMALLAYLGILVIIPLLVARERPFVRYHIKQGLLLVIGWALVWALDMIYIPFNFLVPMLWFILFVMAVMGILNAVAGKEKPLPLIGQYASRFDSFFD
jgi:uncharacterized membrane protein